MDPCASPRGHPPQDKSRWGRRGPPQFHSLGCAISAVWEIRHQWSYVAAAGAGQESRGRRGPPAGTGRARLVGVEAVDGRPLCVMKDTARYAMKDTELNRLMAEVGVEAVEGRPCESPWGHRGPPHFHSLGCAAGVWEIRHSWANMGTSIALAAPPAYGRYGTRDALERPALRKSPATPAPSLRGAPLRAYGQRRHRQFSSICYSNHVAASGGGSASGLS